MEIVSTVRELTNFIESKKKQNQTIGFVPTMGALHRGNLSLVSQAASQTDVVVVSIFVNPTQFNNAEDLKNYPRTLERDAQLLTDTKCQLIFAPTVAEIYPVKDDRKFDFGALEQVMEGRFRPGHFNGVAQVVSRLFALVQPNKAFFGAKDFQQLAIVRQMSAKLMPEIDIVACPIIREEDGLAISSRNTLLTPEMRKKSPVIARALSESTKFVTEKSVEEVIGWVTEQINRVDGFEVEYFSIVDSATLQPVNDWHEGDGITGCIAVYAGKIRLIDNVTYK